MRLKNIYDFADALAPFSLSGEYCARYGAYDNSGVLLDCGADITGVLFALDLTKGAIARAQEEGMNCIFTHHPAIYGKLASLSPEGEGKEILSCAQAGISVVSAHLNLDCAQGGIDECLMEGLGGKRASAVMHPLSAGGYGRVYEVEEQPLATFTEKLKRTFSARQVLVYGAGKVKRVASFCGAGMDEESVAFALKEGADTFVSSDPKHHLVKELCERQCNVAVLTHYAAEFYGFARFYEKMKNMPDVGCRLYADERYL